MPQQTAQHAATGTSADPRLIGRYAAGTAGPTLVVTAGIHGNEPAGARAFRRVLGVLEERDLPLRGELVGLFGNLAASSERKRYVDRDLNRQFKPDQIAGLRSGRIQRADCHEFGEMLDLLGCLDCITEASHGPIYLVDLHTTSSEGEPFACLADTLRNRKFAFQLPLPIILGLEEFLEGTLLDYATNLGHVCIVVEGGQHDNPASVENLEAALWIALVSAKMLRPADIPGYADFESRLRSRTSRIPHILEVRYRHAIAEADQFQMRPGYRNFTPIRKGEILADDARGPVLSPAECIIFMPLYQKLGSDGYFLVHEVRALWLGLSALARRLGLHRLAPRLPGVTPATDRPNSLIVDTAIARWYTVEVFHLLGYRKERLDGTHMIVTRRRHDMHRTRPHPASPAP